MFFNQRGYYQYQREAALVLGAASDEMSIVLMLETELKKSVVSGIEDDRIAQWYAHATEGTDKGDAYARWIYWKIAGAHVSDLSYEQRIHLVNFVNPELNEWGVGRDSAGF
jgi:hypothetical protein